MRLTQAVIFIGVQGIALCLWGKKLCRTLDVEHQGISRCRSLAFPWPDFIRRDRTLAHFGARHVPVIKPWHILLATICGVVNQRQQQISEFQNAQIDALLKQLGKNRLWLNDDQRRILAVKTHAIGRKALHEITKVLTPDC